MASFGDKYTFEIVASGSGFGVFQQVTKNVDDLGKTTDRAAKAQAAAAQVGKSVTQSITRTGQSAQQSAHSFGNFNQALFIAANTMEDAAFGSRAIGNNLLQLVTLVTMRAHPAIAALGTIAVPLLVTANRDWIDGMLASAGILDKNLIPKTKEATEATELYTSALNILESRFENAPKDLQDSAKQIEEIFNESGRAVQTKLVAALTPKIGDRKRIEGEIQRIEKMFQDMEVTPGKVPIWNLWAKVWERELNKRKEDLKAIEQQAQNIGKVNLANLQEQAAEGSDEALQKMADLARQLSGGTDQALIDLANNLERLTTRFAKLSAQTEIDAQKTAENVKAKQDLVEMLNKQGEENEKYTEQVVENAEKRFEAEQKAIRAIQRELEMAELDEKTRRVVEAFNPLLQQRIMTGLQQQVIGQGIAPGAAATATTSDVFGFLMRQGIDFVAATEAAQKMVQQQQELFQADLDRRNAEQAVYMDMIRQNALLVRAEKERARFFRHLQTINRNAAGRFP